MNGPNNQGNVFHLNIYDTYIEFGRRPGFWLRWRGRPNYIARVDRVGPINLQLPNYGEPEVGIKLFHIETGEELAERLVITEPWNTKDWYWVQPPPWSGEPQYNSYNGKVIVHFHDAHTHIARNIGVRWSDLLGAWWLPDDDMVGLACAKRLGFRLVTGPLVYFDVNYNDRDRAKLAGALWMQAHKAWAVPAADAQVLANMAAAGFSPSQK